MSSSGPTPAVALLAGHGLVEELALMPLHQTALQELLGGAQEAGAVVVALAALRLRRGHSHSWRQMHCQKTMHRRQRMPSGDDQCGKTVQHPVHRSTV